jgi:hypothetical protein
VLSEDLVLDHILPCTHNQCLDVVLSVEIPDVLLEDRSIVEDWSELLDHNLDRDVGERSH